MPDTIDHDDRDTCDRCGLPATRHFLSAGFEEDLRKLEDWEHHLDLCEDCANRRREA
jgi:hypothetical protein